MKKLIIILFVLLPSFCTAQNLIKNGDFEQGNSLFTTDYKLNTNSGSGEGVYKVDSDCLNWWSQHNLNCYDHTSGKSNMMYINGHYSANKNIWSQTVNVINSNTYTFSLWLVNLVDYSPAELNVFINNILVGTIKQTNVSINNWKQYSFDWKSTTNTATIKIVDKNIERTGNDFGLDDLSLVEKFTVSKTSIFFPDTVSHIGVEEFKIPMKVKLYDKSLNLQNLSFTTSFKFKADVFLPTGLTKGTILKDSLDGHNYRNMTIFCDSVNLSDTNKLLTELIGTVLLGDSITPLDFIDFEWHNPKLIVVTLIAGSLKTYACAVEMNQIQLFNPIKLQIQPNPAIDEIEVIIEGDELGFYTLNLYDLQGMKIDEKTWNRNQKGKDSYKFPIDNYPNGLYQVVVKSPWNVIVKSVMIAN